MVKVKQRAKKGSISVRKKANGFEARVTLEIEGMQGMRLTRFSAISESDARIKLGETIAEAYLKYGRQRGFTDEFIEQNCSNKMMKFKDFKNNEIREKAIAEANKTTLFKNVAKAWLDHRKRDTEIGNDRKLGKKTFNSYVYTTTKNLIPFFGEVDINNITRDEFQAHIDTIKGHKKAKEEVFIMKLIMEYAILRNWAKRNPIENIILPNKKKREISYLNTKEQDKWLDCIEKDGRQWALLLGTLLQTGMRPEEGCGLKWKAVDLKRQYLSVENAVKEIDLYDDNYKVIGHKIVDSDLKTEGSYRVIPINARLYTMLNKLKQDKKRMYRELGLKWDDNQYVFLNQNGGPYVSQRLGKKITQFIRQNKLEKVTVYGLRHSFATRCSEKGVPDVVLKELMGHSDSNTTKKYYIHVSLDRKIEEMKKAWK